MAERYPKRVNSRLGMKTWEVIKEHSEKAGTSISEIIRMSVVEYAKKVTDREVQELWK